MNKILNLFTISLIMVSCTKKEPLNVIYIMSDDHTSQAIGAYGGRLASLNPTPTIDKLAADGILFENCFCTNSISTPSRACIITGQYSHHNGVLTLDHKLKEDQEYLADEFNKMGYETAMIGKWHLNCEPSSFSYYSVLNGQGTYFDPIFMTNAVTDKKWPNNIIKTKGHSTRIITDITLDWLKNKRDKSKPFFLMHHYKAPHDFFSFDPIYKNYLSDVEIPLPASLFDTKQWGSEGTRGKNDSLRHYIGTSISPRHETRSYVQHFKINTGDFKKDTYLAYQHYLKDYLRCVKGIDDNLKRLFDYLKEEGLWENTVIIYAGDQGMMLGEHDLQDKRWMYEESMRMPLIIRNPRQTVRGERCQLLVNNIDFAPTLIDMAGGIIPEYMDGKSFAPLFNGKEPVDWRNAVYYRYWMHMMHHDIPAHLGIRTKDYKLILFYGRHYDLSKENKFSLPGWGKSHTLVPTPVSFELYDLKKDPYEMVNVADDPHYQMIFNSLKKQLKELRKKIGDTDEKYPHLKLIIDKALN